jgi:hypothetical protein
LHPPVLLSPAVVSRLRHLDDAADVGDGLALGDQLLGGFELADDLLGCVPGAFHGRVPGPVWPAEDSHSPWTDFRVSTSAGQVLWHGHNVLCFAASAHPDRQAEAAVLVDHVQELEPPPVSGGVELKVHGPDLVWAFGLVAPHRAVGRSGPLLLSGCGPLQAFLAPEPVYPLEVHQRALPAQQATSHAPAPADVLGSDLAETPPELGLLQVDDLAAMALGAAVMGTVTIAAEALRALFSTS